MLDRFKQHLESSHLIAPGVRVLVGYSGGADSTCLLELLRLSGVEVVAGHLHHGQRDDAETELKLCEAFCQEIDVPFLSGRADVPLIARQMGVGLEEAGRHARYSFFSQAAAQTDCKLIATAHTRSDDIETILQHIARGTGLAGLAGIPERRENIVRPLLPFSREETRAYCEERALWYHNDPANEDISFSRARIRHRIVPELKAINPGIEDSLTRLAEIADEEDRFLSGMAAAALEQSETPLNGELRFLTLDVEAAFDRAKLTHLPPVLLKRAVRLAVATLGAGLTSEQTQIVVDGLKAQERGSVTAEGGEVVLEWSHGAIVVRQVRPTEPFRYLLTLPGETISDEFGWTFEAFTTKDRPSQTRASLQAWFAREKTKGNLYFRTAQPGDEMRPLGFSGRRKLSDLMSEAKLTQAARSRLPIVCDLVGPLWAPGVCLDERARIDDRTETVIHVSLGPVKPSGSHNKETG